MKESTLKFAHISDLHVCKIANRSCDIDNKSITKAKKLAQDLLKIESILDFIIVSGDITEDASHESFAEFEKIFNIFNIPIYIVPGNHDGPSEFNDFRNGSDFFKKSDISDRVITNQHLKIIGINSCIDRKMTGKISSECLQLIQEEFLKNDSKQIILVLHHPPFKIGLKDFDNISIVEGVEDFGALLKNSINKPIILCGHVHRPYFSQWNGVNCFIAGSAFIQYGAELPFGDLTVQPTNETYSYFIHSIDIDGNHVMTTRSFEQQE